MPLLRAYDAERKTITVSVHAAYLDRLSRDSDIREYLPLLHSEAASRDKPAVVELGARRGNSTLAFLAAAAETGGHVWSVDIDDVLLYPEDLGRWKGLPSWTFLHGSSLDPETWARLPGGIDVFFNDASHEYEETLAECRHYVPLVKPGGVALFHDTRLIGYHGVWQPLTQDEDGGDVPPVRQALDDYCAEAGLSWEELPGRYGLGVIRL